MPKVKQNKRSSKKMIQISLYGKEEALKIDNKKEKR